MKFADYRPTVSDFSDLGKAQQLSCSAAGLFDKKFQIPTALGFNRMVTTGWQAVCIARRPISRKARIAARKAVAQ